MATEITREVAGLVSMAILQSEVSKSRIADLTGIPYSTLNRKLKGSSADFTFPELFAIARVVGVQPSAFIPSPFRAVA
jgi:transcriptional regulator with XRE-family HTH domain